MYGTGRISNCLNRLLHEVLGCSQPSFWRFLLWCENLRIGANNAQNLGSFSPYTTFVHSVCEHHVTNIKITRRNWQHRAPVNGRPTKAYLTALFRVLLLRGRPQTLCYKIQSYTLLTPAPHLYTDMCHNFKTVFGHYFKVKSMSI